MRRPVIGITAYRDDIVREPGVPPAANVFITDTYVRRVEQAGGLAVVIPPRLDAGAEVVDQILGMLDGVLLTGGGDLDPQRYGAQPHPMTAAPREDRDTLEIALARRTAQTGQPCLGICRGMQVMAVAAGGVLDQHLPDRTGSEVHSPVDGVFGSHPVRLVEGTRTAGLLATDGGVIDVPTSHHQSVLEAPGYRPTAWHEDGTLEAMESEDDTGFRYAVQFHPEGGEDLRLFTALVEAARGYVRDAGPAVRHPDTA